jgi:hypothetical protein
MMSPTANSLLQQARATFGAQENANVACGVSDTPRHASADPTDETRTAYLWVEAGQAAPFSKRWRAGSERAVCNWLMLLYVGLGALAIVTAISTKTAPLDATAQLERLAARLARSATIPSSVTSEIARVIEQPVYDCRRVACSAELEARNRIVREQLKQLMAMKEGDDRVPSSGSTGSAKQASAVPPYQ